MQQNRIRALIANDLCLRCCMLWCIASTQLTDTGAAWLSRLPQLTELKLRHCSGITDSGLCHISKLTQLKALDVEGCEGLSSACLVVIGQLQGLSSLNMTQCPGIRGSGLQHIRGEDCSRGLRQEHCQLQHVVTVCCHAVVSSAQEQNDITYSVTLLRSTRCKRLEPLSTEY